METFIPTRTPPPLPGTRILALEAQSSLQVVEQLSRGLAADRVEQLATYLGMSMTQMLELAGIKSSTFFERKKQQQTLSAEASGRIYRLAKVVEAAEDYFEDADAARRWLTYPKVALGGKTPFEFARTAEGAEYVVKLLGRMAHGVIS